MSEQALDDMDDAIRVLENLMAPKPEARPVEAEKPTPAPVVTFAREIEH